jgi:hypothetical protein
MTFENDLIAFEEMLHQHGYRVECRTARSFFEQADGNVKLAFDRFVASLSPAPQPIPEWVQLVDPSGRTYYQNNLTQEVCTPHLFPTVSADIDFNHIHPCRPDGIHLRVVSSLLLASHPSCLPNLTLAAMDL